VLTVAKVTSANAAGYAEYLEGRSQPAALGDYYLKDGERVEAPGRWVRGAEAVRCDPDQPVGGGVLRRLMAVRRPDTGLALRRAGGNGEVVAAIDATFSAPKSVSAMWAVASEELRDQIEQAHEAAIDRALGYAIGVVAMVRERVDAGTVVKANALGVIATSWRHTAARAVAGQPPDPQLHSHVLLHAAIRRDGQVVAIDSRAWFVHRRELGAAYRTELARELADLGFGIRRGTGRGERYFEIDGVPAQLIDRWSSRHHQVQQAITARVRDKQRALQAVVAAGGPDAELAARRLEELRATGRVGAAEDRLATTATRSAKQPQLVTRGDLDAYWAREGRSHGLTPNSLGQLRAGEQALQPAADRALLARLTEFDATFSEREARAVALEASAGVSIDRSLWAMHQLRTSGELLPLADGRETTRQHRRAERETVTVAGRLSVGRVAAIPRGLVAQATRRLDEQLGASGARLSDSQREAVILACSEAQLVVIQGQAGTGKSTVLTGVARAHQADGQTIIVTSTAALGAHRLATDLAIAGVAADAYSTSALHAALTSGRVTIGPATTVIHDEAALASTREQHQLLSAVEATGARLIEIGDPQQSQPVGAGGLWERLEHATRTHQAHVELTDNVRARDAADRRDQARFRQGRHQQAIEGYAARGRVTIHSQQRQAEDAALDAAHHDHSDGQRTLVIAQTSNEHLDELNARAQAIRRQHHELGTENIPIPGRPYRLHAGDLVQIRRSIHHNTAGPIRNGHTGQVIAIDPERDALTIELGPNRTAILDRAHLERADLRLAYVQHPFPAQGQTTDTTHVIVSEHATNEGTYVALTRAQHRTHLYTSHQQLHDPDDPLVALAEHTARTEPDIPSIHTPIAREAQIQRHQAHELDNTEADPGNQDKLDLQSIGGPPPQRVGRQSEMRDVGIKAPPTATVTPLGPRPSTSDPNHAAGLPGASAIERYSREYAIPDDDPHPLGPEPPPGAFQQRLDRRAAASLFHQSLEQPGRRHIEDGAERAPAPRDAERSAADGSDGWQP
jgi:conjugative relaxase-like TrwC/TraI family protein